MADVQKSIRERNQRRQSQQGQSGREQDGNNGDVRMDDGGTSEVEVNADADEGNTAALALTTARDTILREVNTAYNTSKQTLDLLSLWMSKERPTQAMGTLDNELRQLVGIGTIDSTKLHEPIDREGRQRDNIMVVTGQRLLSVNESASKLQLAASRLQQECGRETKYWQDVHDVSGRGWPVARHPGDPSTMSVKFGFSESTVPDFQANSWAAMRRADDGSVSLDTGKLVSVPKRVLVSLEKDGRVFGRSSLPRPPSKDSPVEERVRDARNTILAQELWHEINREGRTLLAYNVKLRPDSVVYKLDDHTTITFTLVTLGDEPDVAPAGPSRTGDGYAETVCVGLHLLLAYAHRQSAQKRTHLVPLSLEEGIASKPPYNLIRPVISYLQHELSLRSTVRFLASLSGLLRLAGIGEAGYTLQEHVFPPLPTETASESLLTLMLSPLRYRIELKLTPQARLEIVGVGHVTSSQQGSTSYRITLLPAASAETQSGTPSDRGTHPLSNLYPPAGDYPTREEAFGYLRAATLRVLANHCEILAKGWTAEARQRDEAYNTTWTINAMGDGIRDRETGCRGVTFELVSVSDGRDAAPRLTELKVKCDQLSDEGTPSHRVWSWKAEDLEKKGKGHSVDALEAVLHPVLMRPETVAASESSRHI